MSIDLKELSEYLKQIEYLFADGSYFELEYILKDTFISEKHMALKNILIQYIKTVKPQKVKLNLEKYNKRQKIIIKRIC